MPRKVRIEYPGAIDHVMSRGDQRDDIFLNDANPHDSADVQHCKHESAQDGEGG